MRNLYPLKFKPVFKDKIWGGTRIRDYLKLDYAPLSRCGEAWVLSGVKDNQTVISNGWLAGNELNELVEVYMDDLVGEECYLKYENEFPILVKFIDANDYLSIQVHPDDELAKIRHNGSGKTEMWYVLEAEKNAELISGFSKTIDRDTYIKHLNEKRLKEILNIEKVKMGDVFYIPSGRVHALGPGILLAEIQQTSDITYRIYDWDRIDENGNSRELHTAQALDAIDFAFHDDYRTTYKEKKDSAIPLVSSPYFNTRLWHLTHHCHMEYGYLDSFVIYVCVLGEMKIKYSDGEEYLQMGETLLIPASMTEIEIIPEKESRILEVFLI